MKKIFLIVILFIASNIFAQFDLPYGYTEWYNFAKYRQGARSSAAVLNSDKDMMDSLFHYSIVVVDTMQFVMELDTTISHDTTLYVLKHSPYSMGHNSFSGTAQYDTVLVPGIDSLDIVTVTIREAIPGANDRIGVIIKSGKFIVCRAASGTSGLKYDWIYRREYQ